MTRTTAATSLLLTAALMALSGCGWRGGGEVTLRNAPYPYEACMAIDDGASHDPLALHGATFVWSGQQVGTMGQDAMCSLIDRGRQLWESLVFLFEKREWRGGSFFANRLIEPVASGVSGAAPATGRRAPEHAFKTCVGRIPVAGAGVPNDVAVQMAEAAVYELRAKGGLSIIGAAGGGRDERGGARLDESVSAYLDQEHTAGRLCLMSLGRLLAYDFVRRNLVWSADRIGSDVTIRILAVDDGLGTRWIPTIEELEGITFYTPDAAATRVFIGSKQTGDVTVNGRDSTRRESVTIARAALLGEQ